MVGLVEDFRLKDHDFIELNKLLKVLNWVSSGGEAKQVIDERRVKVNGKLETQRRKKLRVRDVVEFEGQKARVEK